jgi:serine/threonine protein kinase
MEFSSIILGEPWSAEHQHSGATDTSSTSIGSHHDDDHEDDDARPVEFGFLDVLDVLRQYQVPSLDLCYAIGTTEIDEQQTSVTGCSLERKAVRANRRFSHMLGGGYSATVLRHVTKEDVFALATEGDVIAERDPELVVKAGTVIAFKKITPRPSGNGASDLARRSGAFRTICQEIKVSKHAQLRSHENISGILYVAWQRSEEFPWLALSLAAFGTLEDILTAPGERPTSKHKLNLTADVAFGVAALHRADIIHGDLKPANVLVHHHHDSNRQIIGKITDFGGSVSAGEGHPSIGTPLWCAPEVAATTAKTDWKLADVWSYGLIVASIWSERSSRSCYLEKLISEHLEGSVRNARLFLIKSEPDASSDSIVSRCMDLDFTIRPLLLNTLSRQPTRRLTLDTIISTSLRSICEGLKRESVIIAMRFLLV